FSAALDFDSYDVIAVNSNSRGMNAGEAYRTVRETIKRLEVKRRGCFFYKKIDSVLRGNPGEELAAVMDELEMPLALAAPSFPANRSVMEHGLLSSGGNGTGASGPIDAVQVFSRGINRKVGNIPLEEIRRGRRAVTEYIETHNAAGVQVFVADAVTDEDINTIYRTAAGLGKPLILAGAAALACHAARDFGGEKSGSPAAVSAAAPVRLPGQNNSVLVIAGTRRGETAAQITTLSRIMPVPIIRFKVDLVGMNKSEEAVDKAYHEAAVEMRKKAGLCIIAVESMFRAEIPLGNVDKKQVEGDETGEAISQALGILTRKLLDDFQFSVIISTGGDTSLGICRCLEIKGIEPVAEICPGIPVGRIAGGTHARQYIITKSGRFGDKRSLLEIMDYLGLTKKNEMEKGLVP
ncbi:MAG: hypothetical protein LBG10_06610, partial [Treponema sp.]|nr:hypothetical protein [Treponema sp.]